MIHKNQLNENDKNNESLTVGVPCWAIKTDKFERISSKELLTSGDTVSSNIRPTNSPFQKRI
jgi:hypothetical protein